MTNIWIALLLVMSTFVSFRVGIDIGYINRTFSSINFAIYYEAVEWGFINNTNQLSFNRDTFRRVTTAYYAEKLKGRVSSFSLLYTYKNLDDSLSMNTHCQKILIGLKTTVYGVIDFDRVVKVEWKGV